ncbi:hypothetical protein BDR07DRAFT_1464504 [Suillus spraguei]|nr:hypothetical protein BDR07DRAFT_1464504 [Suillus spraguei]
MSETNQSKDPSTIPPSTPSEIPESRRRGKVRQFLLAKVKNVKNVFVSRRGSQVSWNEVHVIAKKNPRNSEPVLPNVDRGSVPSSPNIVDAEEPARLDNAPLERVAYRVRMPVLGRVKSACPAQNASAILEAACNFQDTYNQGNSDPGVDAQRTVNVPVEEVWNIILDGCL